MSFGFLTESALLPSKSKVKSVGTRIRFRSCLYSIWYLCIYHNMILVLVQVLNNIGNTEYWYEYITLTTPVIVCPALGILSSPPTQSNLTSQ